MKRKNRSTAKIRLSGDPILETICELVEDGENIDHIVRDMMFVLINSKTGVGIAANQVGYAKRVIIIKCASFQILTNPLITNVSESEHINREGCLSYPGRFVDIKRYSHIKVECDEWSGERIYRDWPARIIQHEIDHLNGKCKVAN